MNRFLQSSTLVLACLLIVSCGAPGEPAPTQTQTPIPSTTFTPTISPTVTPVPSGPCDNPLMSLDVGNQWKYRATTELGTSEQVLRVAEWNEEVGLNAVIEMEDLDTGTVSSDWVTCKDGGAIEDFPLFFISLQMGDYMDGVFNTFYQSGIYAPAYSELVANNWLFNWGAEYLTEEAMCFTNVVENVGLCINRTSPIDLTFETQGEYESVTVPAGTFPQALKVSFSFRMATTLVYPTLATSAPLTVTTTQWYAPFIGLVRSQIDSAGVEILPGQESAAPVDSVVELIEYTVTP